MVRKEFKSRIATIYFHSSEDLDQWKQRAKDASVPLSAFVYEMARKSLDAEGNNQSRLESVKELSQLRRENNDLLKTIETNKIAIETLKADNAKLRRDASDESRLVNNEIMKLFLQHRNAVLTGKDLDKAMELLGREKNVKHIISASISSLIDSGLIQETGRGWRLREGTEINQSQG